VTCSVFPAENGEQINRFVARQSAMPAADHEEQLTADS
jgi:16S rRNA C967 or C1407 C5-methylase (RsmB/RsmF family)